MTALPPSTDFTGASITEAQFKTALTSLRSFISELLGTSGTDKVAALTALGAILGDSLDKTGAYTVVAADKGKVINCTTGTWTLSLTAAATLGDGFAFAVWNNGAGTITIDPNASEQIDGATTKELAAGKLAIVYCDGSKFVTVGSIATGSGSGLDADLLDGQHASAFAGANRNFDWELVGTHTSSYPGGGSWANPINIYSNYGAGIFRMYRSAGLYSVANPQTYVSAGYAVPNIMSYGSNGVAIEHGLYVSPTATSVNFFSDAGGSATFQIYKLRKLA